MGLVLALGASGLVSIASADTIKPQAQKSSKNGFSIGVEGNIGRAYSFNDPSPTYKPTSNNDMLRSTFIDLGLIGAYQHYFGENQRQGFKISGHIDSGIGSSWREVIEDAALTLSYIPIKFGLDIKYLWDFLEQDGYTLGVHIGVGYAYDMYEDGKWIFKVKGSDIEPVVDASPISLGFIYPVLGLHYYYGHHQFELLWRGGGAIGATSKPTDTDTTGESPLYVTIISNSYATLSYAYRF
ncbi:hypothetical protein BKH46_03810 [Helicobacter sp. 12S02634-8]|uniref:outer membrane beta-barrel protein n=1 Tax=Helicobacter sp. 12S02634-8 TaxID=1476199 RepID=UPI000BCD12EE|nr:outer membrane beta-barrel protein [Helicobacter sp. 12S02634-8]PAF47561.1 hypothetical protein BKH46_03810 [Helicobacter sp. 12S02634-8]